MGFLDEVKKKQAAERVREAGDQASQAQSELPAHVQQVAGSLTMLADGLGAFARRLRAGMPDIRADYTVEIYGSVKGLRQGNYHFDKAEDLRIRFGFECRGSGDIEFTTESREVCDRVLDELIKAGLKVQYRSHADWKFLFCVTPLVPVEVVFEPHKTDPVVQLTLKNLEWLGVRVERLAPERIDENFLDQLKQCVLRQPNDFAGLLGNRISDDLREQFRAKIAKRRQQRTHDETEPESTEPDAMQKLKGLFSLGSKKRRNTD